MKTPFNLILILFAMNAYSQTPPTPPISKAGITNSGITYSLAETDNSIVFACTFNNSLHPKIWEIIHSEYTNFPKLDKEIKFISNENEFKYKIELYNSELKLEYKGYSKKNDLEFKKIKRIYTKILNL